MTDTNGPQRDELRDPQQAAPMWVEPAQPGATYPPGFEPGAPEVSPAEGIGGPPGTGDVAPTAESSTVTKRSSARRPIVAGVVGGALIALLGFGGGYMVGGATGGHDGDRLSTQGISQLTPPNGENHGDGDGDGGPGLRPAPGAGLPNTGSQESGADT